MKREKRLTKREKKAQNPNPQPQQAAGGGGHGHHQHIHCTACGTHLDEEQFDADPPSALWLRCEHHSEFPSCTGCADKTRELLAEHDRTGKPVQQASAWH